VSQSAHTGASILERVMDEDTVEWLDLRFEERRVNVGDEEPSRFVTVHQGGIELVEDDGETRTEIGTFKAVYIDALGVVTEGDSLFDVFDYHQATVGYYEALYDHDQEDFKPSVVQAACGDDFLWASSLLILDRLVIYPEFRGKRRGLRVLIELMLRLRTGAGLVAMRPFPLQHEYNYKGNAKSAEQQRLKLDGFSSDPRRATAALRRYYGRLGFIRVPRTDYMVLSPLLRLSKPA
jgi:GNAT superfamily N-acetyltransferase